MTVFLGILFSYIREIEVPYGFDGEHGTPHHGMLGNRASSCGEGEVSCVFSSCGRHLVYTLELRWGWPFETRVCSAKSGLLSSYDGHIGKLDYAFRKIETLLEVSREAKSPSHIPISVARLLLRSLYKFGLTLQSKAGNHSHPEMICGARNFPQAALLKLMIHYT